MQGLLSKSISKALSLCEYDNIQNELDNIKKCVVFDKNRFLWNDASQKFKSYTTYFHKLENYTD